MSGFSAKFHSVRVTPATVWLFVSLDDGDHVGWGEATLSGQEDAVAALFDVLPGRVDAAMLDALPLETLPQAAVASALRQALADLEARREGVALAEHLGGIARRRIGVYANINRRTRERSPEGMAQSARDALAAGHVAIKIAPFDEVRADLSRADMDAAMQPGLARIAAVRGAIGDRRLMVDCHWRFDQGGAERLIDACAPLALHWIECPVAETEADIPALKALRRRANAAGMLLAGLETTILRAGFAPFIRAGAYDVMMPDVKYCGGPQEMLALATDMARHDVQFSPHNPSGPICHAHSLHICATLPDCDLLETQFDETPMFDALVTPPPPATRDGCMDPPDAGAGLGLSLTPSDEGKPI